LKRKRINNLEESKKKNIQISNLSIASNNRTKDIIDNDNKSVESEKINCIKENEKENLKSNESKTISNITSKYDKKEKINQEVIIDEVKTRSNTSKEKESAKSKQSIGFQEITYSPEEEFLLNKMNELNKHGGNWLEYISLTKNLGKKHPTTKSKKKTLTDLYDVYEMFIDTDKLHKITDVAN